MQSMGKIILVGGVILVVIGLILWLFGDKMGWLGNLPGDIKIRKENFSFYFPVVTMILVSLVLSLLWWVIKKFF